MSSTTPGGFLRSNKWLRRIVWLILAIALLWVVLWLAVPPLLRSNAEKYGSQFLGRDVKVGAVEFSPWTLELTVRDLSVASADGASKQVEVGRIYIDAEMQSLLRLAPVVDAIEVDKPTVRVAHLTDGRFDFDDVLKRFADQPKSDKPGDPPLFAVYNIVLRDGTVDFDDRTVGSKQELRDLQLSVPFLSNLSKAAREVKVTPKLAFKLNGSAFDTVAAAKPFAETHQADADFRIKDFDLGPFAAYIPKSVPVRLDSGVLDADLKLSFEQKDQPKVAVMGNVSLQKFKVSDAQKQDLAAFERLDVALADVQPLKGIVHVASVQLQAPHFAVRRDKAGNLDIPGMAPSAAAADKKKDSKPSADAAEAKKDDDKSKQAAWQVQLDHFGLVDGVVDWTDQAVAGESAHLSLHNVVLGAKQIAWPMKQPVKFLGSANLNSGGEAGKTPATLGFEGLADLEQAKVAASLRALPLEWAAPYLNGVIEPRVGGQLTVDLGVARKGDVLIANLANGTLKSLSLTCPAKGSCDSLQKVGVPGAGRNTVAELGQLELQNVAVDVQRRKVALGKVEISQPKLFVGRAKDGKLMFEDWLPPAKSSSAPQRETAAASSSKQTPWSIQLSEVELKDGAVVLRDETTDKPLLMRLNAIQAGVREFVFPAQKGHTSQVKLAARIAGPGRAEPGSLRYDGSFGMLPIAAQGKVQATALPLHVAQPYLPKNLNVNILRADGSFNGDVKFTMLDAGPAATVKGNLSLDDVRVRTADAGGNVKAAGALATGRDAEDLLNWKVLALKGVAVDLNPGKPLALDVAETTLSDFFARVIVQENGRINLQDIQGDPVAAVAPEGAASAASAPVAVASAASAPAPVASAAVATVDPMAPIIRFGPVNIVRGAMHFTDHFVKPNYSTDLSELNGRLSAFSSVRPAGAESFDMADLQLTGKAEGTASVDVSGKLNPLAKPLALDIQAKMRDLELPPLSPYSIKYAGHGIERGKLSMDVAYKIEPNGQLTASNKLILNQLAFGDKVEGAPASLPVRLAVALLADRNGVIDVDLPISGSLNDPQFSLGGVIFKVIGNLIMKAVTAPFSLLASAFGGGDEQGSVPFDAGKSVLSKSAKDNLDKVAKALNDRPALKMTVVGWADAQAEQDAIKREQLNALVLAQKRRKVARDGGETAEVKAVDPAEYSELLKDTYKRADIKKPRNMVGLSKDLPDAEMESLLLASIKVPDNAAQELALARGVAVRDYLASQKVPMDRLFVGASKLQADKNADSKWSPKAELTLAAQ